MTNRDQKAAQLIEELIATARHMSAKKRSWFVFRLEEGLGATSSEARGLAASKTLKIPIEEMVKFYRKQMEG